MWVDPLVLTAEWLIAMDVNVLPFQYPAVSRYLDQVWSARSSGQLPIFGSWQSPAITIHNVVVLASSIFGTMCCDIRDSLLLDLPHQCFVSNQYHLERGWTSIEPRNLEFHHGRPNLPQNLPMTQVWGCRGVVPGNFAHQGLVRTMRAAPAWRSRSWCRSHKWP